ncbi:MAG: acyl-homoserine-lactone synthase [Pseudomonadota bacterium]
MYFIIHGNDIQKYPHLADQMFRLRSRVFRDELKWVASEGEHEADEYDGYNPVYVMHTDPLGIHLFACGRLMPTSGPTLLADVFGETIPDVDFASPFVWEITRLCIDDELIRKHGRDSERMAILRSLHVAALEFGLSAGVDAFLANFDDLRLRMWRRMKVHFDVLGTSEAFSTRVHLGITECSQEILDQARTRLGLSEPLLEDAPALLQPAPMRLAVAA